MFQWGRGESERYAERYAKRGGRGGKKRKKFYFHVRAFSIPRTQIPRSLEQAIPKHIVFVPIQNRVRDD